MPFVFSQYFSQISFGTWTIISFSSVFVLLIIMTRHFEPRYLISFFVSNLVGILNDLFTKLWTNLPEQICLLIVYYFIGWCCLSLGIACFIVSDLPPTTYELFIRDIAKYKHISLVRAKTMFDLGCLITSILFIVLVLKQMKGIGIGTVIAGLFNGTAIGLWIKLINRHLIIQSTIRVS